MNVIVCFFIISFPFGVGAQITEIPSQMSSRALNRGFGSVARITTAKRPREKLKGFIAGKQNVDTSIA